MSDPVLRRGDIRAEVRIAQSLLQSQGYYPYKLDDIFGRLTEQGVAYFQQTHLGPNSSKFLSATSPAGVIDADTWWALRNPSGDEQRNFLDGFIPSGLSAPRRAILQAALKEHRAGVHEIPDGSNWGDGVTKYLEGIGAVYWCCYFTSWVIKQATGNYPLGERHGHCGTFYREAREAGRVYKAGDKIPVPGDLFVYLYKGTTSGPGHIGFVLQTAQDGVRFNSIAGNEGNRVKLGVRDIRRESQLAGFIDVIGDSDAVRSKFSRGLITASSSDSSVGGTR